MSCRLEKFLPWLQYLKWTFISLAEREGGGGGKEECLSFLIKTNLAVFSLGEILDFGLPYLVVGMGAN